MKYYELINNSEDSFESVCIKAELYGCFNQYMFEKGHEIKEWDDKVIFHYDKNEGRLEDYQANELNLFLISPKFKELLKESTSHLQFLPVKIKVINDNTIIQDYRIVNILDLVKGLDLKQSRFDEIEKNIRIFESYTLKQKVINNLDVFRLSETTEPIFISDKIKIFIDKHGITGCSFTEVNVM